MFAVPNRSLNLKAFLVAIIISGFFNFASAAENLEIVAGAYAQDISPTEFPISVNGNMSDVLATSVHDPIHARCLVLANGDVSIAIVVCDSCMLPREVLDDAKQMASEATGIPIKNILISATHAHSCPTATGVFQSDPDLKYLEFLKRQIAAGIEVAFKQREPARVGFGSVDEPSQLFNRRWVLKHGETNENPFGGFTDRVVMNPGYSNSKVERQAGPVDPQVSVLAVQARSGRPLAILSNYSLHYVGGVAGPVVSADYFGEFCSRISRHIAATDVKPAFVGILSNGTSGDVNNVNFSLKMGPRRQPFEQINFVAEVVATAAARAYDDIEYDSTPVLKMIEEEIELGVRRPTSDELAAAERKLAEHPDRPLKGLPAVYARETVLLSKYPATVKAKLQAIRIGSLAIVTSPCETFTETGLAIKKASPLKSTFTIELANGYNGYLPTPEQHQLGGYETWRARSSYLATDAEPKVRSTLLRLLSQLAK